MKFIFLSAILGFYTCSESKNSNQLNSKDYDSKVDRIEVLKKEITSNSDFENAEFELFNVNGFSNSRTSVPGASSWDYKFVIKVKTSDLDKWTEGMIKLASTNYNDAWTTEIIKKRKTDWETESKPEFYTRKGDDVMLILYRNEGIIFKRVINN